jgi:hypothetical protein
MTIEISTMNVHQNRQVAAFAKEPHLAFFLATQLNQTTKHKTVNAVWRKSAFSARLSNV